MRCTFTRGGDRSRPATFLPPPQHPLDTSKLFAVDQVSFANFYLIPCFTSCASLPDRRSAGERAARQRHRLRQLRQHVRQLQLGVSRLVFQLPGRRLHSLSRLFRQFRVVSAKETPR